MDDSNTQEAALEAKQAYLRDNIDPNLYEDFVDYCSTQTDAIDINSWSIEYVKEVNMSSFSSSTNSSNPWQKSSPEKL